MSTRRRADLLALLPPLAVLAFAIVFLNWALIYDETARQVPVLVAWSLIVLCVLDLIASTRTAPGRMVKAFFTGTIVGEAAADDGVHPPAKVLVAMGWPVAFVALVYVFGFLPVIPVYVFAFVRLQGRKPVRQALGAALCATAFTWVVFEFLLDYEVYEGLLAGG